MFCKGSDPPKLWRKIGIFRDTEHDNGFHMFAHRLASPICLVSPSNRVRTAPDLPLASHISPIISRVFGLHTDHVVVSLNTGCGACSMRRFGKLHYHSASAAAHLCWMFGSYLWMERLTAGIHTDKINCSPPRNLADFFNRRKTRFYI